MSRIAFQQHRNYNFHLQPQAQPANGIQRSDVRMSYHQLEKAEVNGDFEILSEQLAHVISDAQKSDVVASVMLQFGVSLYDLQKQFNPWQPRLFNQSWEQGQTTSFQWDSVEWKEQAPLTAKNAIRSDGSINWAGVQKQQNAYNRFSYGTIRLPTR